MNLNYSKEEIEKVLKYKSKDHHYIPQFLTKAFTNEKGLLYIYDKSKGKILDKQRPSKSIFFEEDRNTVSINGTKSSVIEDESYLILDNKCSEVIKKYQSAELNEIDFDENETEIILLFLITTYWRVPFTNFSSQDLLNSSKIIGGNVDEIEFKKDDFTKKIFRNTLFDHHINEINTKSKVQCKWNNIHRFQNDTFVLGDFPFVPKVMTNVFSEFNDRDILFAISSKRIYSSTLKNGYKITFNEAMRYNAAIIKHSIRYIVSGNYEILSESVKYYERLVKNGFIHSINELVFDKSIK